MKNSRTLRAFLVMTIIPFLVAAEDAPSPGVARTKEKSAENAIQSDPPRSSRATEIFAASMPKFKTEPEKPEPVISIGIEAPRKGPEGENSRRPSIFSEPVSSYSGDPTADAQLYTMRLGTEVPLFGVGFLETNTPTSLINQHTADKLPPPDAIMLPRVVISAPKFRTLDKEQIMSRDEFSTLLRKRYPGASVPGQDPYHMGNGPPNYARLQLEDDRRKTQKAAFENFADLLKRTGDNAGSEGLKEEIRDSLGSPNTDPLIDAMDKSVNGWRR